MPIINQPQVAILSTDAIVRKPVVVATADGGEAIAIHPVGNLAMAGTTAPSTAPTPPASCVRIKEILETRDWTQRSERATTSTGTGLMPRACAGSGTVPYREALAVQQALFDHGRGGSPAAARAPARVHARAARRPRRQRARRSGRGRRRPGRRQARRRRHLPRPGPAGRLPDPVASPNSLGAGRPRAATSSSSSSTPSPSSACRRGRLDEYPGVWVDPDGPEPAQDLRHRRAPRHGRTMHGFALNVATDMRYMRELHRPVRHRRRAGDVAGRGGHRTSRCATVVDVVARLRGAAVGRRAASSARTSRGATGPTTCRRSRVARAPGEPVRPGVAGSAAGRACTSRACRSTSRKPEWLRPKVHHGPEVLALKQTVRDLGLVTVCEEAGCPNLSASAGPTARRRSWCSASAARGRAGSASSTPASPRRRRRTSRPASPRRSTAWASTTPC